MILSGIFDSELLFALKHTQATLPTQACRAALPALFSAKSTCPFPASQRPFNNCFTL